MQKTKQFLLKEGRKATYKIYLGVIFSLTFLFLFSLSLTSATDSFGYGLTESIPINYSNIVINETSNMTNSWDTNIGILDGVNSTQFENQGGNLSIKTSWLTSFIEAVSKWTNYWTKTENITGVDYIQTNIINFSGGIVYYNGTDNIWDFS